MLSLLIGTFPFPIPKSLIKEWERKKRNAINP